MAERTVKLSRRYVGHEPFDAVVIREPTFGDYMDLGEPYEWQRGPNGAPVLITYGEVVKGYLERCAKSPNYANLAVVDSISDARAIREGMLGFFLKAGTSDEKPENSSSPSDGTPAASKE